jgi:hypothetical protein
VVEVQVRGHEVPHRRRVDPERREPAGDVLARRELHVEDARRETEASRRIGAGGGVHAAVEDDRAVRVLAEERGHRDAEVSFLAGEKAGRRAGEPAAGHGEESDRHGADDVARPEAPWR